MYKILKSRKGISPILATLLLIVIAVAAVIVTYAWVMTFTGTQTQQAGAVLQVVNKYFNNSTTPKTIEITLLNSGTADAKIADVYVGTSATSLVKQTSVTYNPSNIVGANGKSTVITISYNWKSGQRYYFNIITEAGQQVPFNEAPS